MDRRQFIRAGSAASAATALGLTAGCASTGSAAGAKVVVVGGGPGGVEAARVLAERGFAVVLFEARAELGGQLG